MALRETIELDVAAARRQIQSLETALNGLDTMLKVDVSGNAKTEIETIDNKLDAAVRSAERLNVEMTAAARGAGLAEVNVEAMARALNISEAEANQLVTELLQAQAAGNRTEDAARDIARQLGLAGKEAEEFVRSLNRADTAAESINVHGSTLVSTFGGVRTAAAGIAGVLATIGIGRGIGAAVQGARSAVNEFARLNESINAVEVTFEEASEQIFAFGQISAKSAGLSAQTFQQAVVPIGAVLRNFGFDAREAASASIDLVQRAADLASVFNTDVNDALLAINSALVGQVEPLRRYGAEISVARAEQFAFATGIAKTKGDLDAATLTQARFGLILADTNRVAGDFVNTSGDFANATRIAKAEFEEFGATIGQALLPAFEGLLGLIPDVIDGLRFLVPAFAEASTAAGDFFDELDEGLDKGSPFLGFFAGVQGGLGTFVDAFAGFGDLLSFAVDSIFLDFEKAGASADRFDKRIRNVALRIGSASLADEITATGDRLTAFANALSFVARETDSIDSFSEAYRRFAIQADISIPNLQIITRFLLENAQQAGLSALEIGFLRGQLNALNEELDTGGRANEDYLTSIASIGEELTRAPGRFAAFVGALDDTDAGIQTFAERVNTAMSGVSAALDPFKEAEEPIKLSAKQFFANLVKQVEAEATFSAGLVRLIQLGFDDVALAIAAEGPRAQSALDSALGNLTLTASSEALLEGQGNKVTAAINQGIIDGLKSDSFTIAQQAAFVDLIERGIITNPEVIAALGRAGTETAATLRGQYAEALSQEEPAFASASQDSIERAIIEGVSGMSVTELAAALNIPLQQAALAIKLRISPDQIIFPSVGAPIVVGPGGKAPATPGGAIGGGFTQNNNFFTAPQPTSDTTRIIQSTAQVRNLVS